MYKSYSIHRQVSCFPILIGLIMALVVETTVVHVLMARGSMVAAGIFRAFVHSSIQIAAAHLLMRTGISWQASTPLGNNAKVPLPASTDHPVEVVGMSGIRRKVKEIWLSVDDVKMFQNELEAARTIHDIHSTQATSS